MKIKLIGGPLDGADDDVEAPRRDVILKVLQVGFNRSQWHLYAIEQHDARWV